MHTKKIRGRAIVDRLVTCAALVLTTTLASGCSASSAPEPKAAARTELTPSPWVLFQQDAGARQEIAMVRTDGTDRTTPLHDLGSGHQTNPDWSPDGKQLVFAMSDGERDDLWVADADGGNAHLLLDCTRLCRWLDDPAWSPDGKQIVYSQTKLRQSGSGTSTLETVDLATGRVRVVLGPWSRQFTSGARYSPDGRRVVFEKVHKVGPALDADFDGVTLSVVALDKPGHPIRGLTDPALYAATADWSPDGTRIVYTALARPDGHEQDLFWIRPRGGEATRITHVSDDGGYAVEPAWLPDDTGVLFSGRLDGAAGSPELLTVNIDGSGVGSAFGETVLLGRHPRVQTAP